MATLYVGLTKLVKVDQKFSDMLVSDTRCTIYGMTILRKGTPGWGEYLARKRQALEGITPPNELDEIMARFGAAEVHYKATELAAINFEHRFEHPDRYVPKRVIFGGSHGIAAEVSAGKKLIDVFRRSKGIGEFGDPKIVEASFCYDGDLREALSEFERKGYQFNLWDIEWNAENLENGKRTGDIKHVRPIKGVGIERILSGQKRG